MDLVERLRAESDELVDQATAKLGRASLTHYDAAGPGPTRARLDELFGLLLTCLSTRTLTPIVTHSQWIAEERFHAGFGLEEVQVAFNVLEETLWLRLVKEVPTAELAEDLGLVATVLGAGKDQLARTYVSLATHDKAPSMDLRALFRGESTAVGQ
jgi:hypothetical protein